MYAAQPTRADDAGSLFIKAMWSGKGRYAGSIRRVLRFLALFPVIALTACGPSKAELDAEVRRLCALDGGLKIFERVVLPPDQLNQVLKRGVRAKNNSAPIDELYFEIENVIIVSGNPELSKHTYKYIRRSDGKVIAHLVVYGRGGGDFWGPWHESSFSCPDSSKMTQLERTLFERGNR